MTDTLHLNSWASIVKDCPMRYRVHDGEDIVFTWGSSANSFEFCFSTEPLRRFVELGTRALAEAETQRAAEEAEDAEQQSA
ncbi:hypothetical protein [Actinokineospora sp.]|uniref:hypothetical protein n=1 Tax=Actinokineospora sp. TaxID=1872133 RepID=UPI004037D346